MRGVTIKIEMDVFDEKHAEKIVRGALEKSDTSSSQTTFETDGSKYFVKIRTSSFPLVKLEEIRKELEKSAGVKEVHDVDLN